MIPYSQALQSVIGTRSGIAAVHLLDVQDPNGNCYYWASQAISAPSVITPNGQPATNAYVPWVLGVPKLQFHRSQRADTITLVLQNLSGDTLQTDFERIVTKNALTGSLICYRRWHAAAEDSSREFHAKIESLVGVKKVTITAGPIDNESEDITPQYQLGEICQWRWSSPQCGSTQPTPCQQSFPTCQVLSRFSGITNNFEKNFGEALAQVQTKTMQRIREY
ncbi:MULTISPECIES: hypothetical protein [Acidobacterium]|uniref:Uncharacterized protein n=1 Tax=Acidobacterium capsulatum (strain ATCC 51196 / DSM 11244 / BCRC 80197 / JCM 7670 / NBRC 15755 / NCIMB 13165 / 161) TaxID=240015 RepID=C1FA35_ACIC5|nr:MULTISPECIES: hypothetical protein [Acidobacterium]ACO33625.1 hypothetical protein ACP_0416 [Acidobacterium capsulatum ATCC 51196]HCT62041.1 hypothetical protein [Acidobacterium sp.]